MSRTDPPPILWFDDSWKIGSADLWRFGRVSAADRMQIREKVDDSHGSAGFFLFFVFGNFKLLCEELCFLNTPKVPLDAP